MGGGVKGRLGLFRKFIRFGRLLTQPLVPKVQRTMSRSLKGFQLEVGQTNKKEDKQINKQTNAEEQALLFLYDPETPAVLHTLSVSFKCKTQKAHALKSKCFFSLMELEGSLSSSRNLTVGPSGVAAVSCQ